MAFTNYRDESRKNYGLNVERNLNCEQLTVGAILRIADATETMCQDRERLERDYAYMRRERDRYRDQFHASERSRSALKGVITRLKKRFTPSHSEGDQ